MSPFPSPYNEAEERKRYIWRHYPDVVRPHECIAHPDDVESALPDKYRDIFRQFYDAVTADDRSFVLPPDAESIIEQTRNDIETANFNTRVNGHQFDIHRCAQCSRIL